MTRVSELASLTTPVSGDLLPIIDVSDTSMAATGTNKKITYGDLLGGYATSADVQTAISGKQNVLSRDPVGDYGTFGMLSMRESGFPRGPDSLTTPQKETYEKGWGVATASTTVVSGGDAGTYYDNTLMFGWNVHGQVYQESSIRLSFESMWTNSGNVSGMVQEWHIDGFNTAGNYFRTVSGIVPKYAGADPDLTSGITFTTQLVNFADWSGNGFFALDARGGAKKAILAAGSTFDLRDITTRKQLRQLIDPGTNLWAWLPYIDYESSEIKIKSDYPLLVTGRMIAQGRVSGTEIRVNDNPNLQIGKACGAGYITGFNINEGSGTPRYATNGYASGMWILQNAIRFFSNDSGTAGAELGVWGMDIIFPSAADQTYLRLFWNGNWQRVTVGATDSGGTGFRVLRIPN